MKNREGFTLVELMLVTMIIGVLATVAVSGFTNVRERAKLAATRSELRNVITAAERYQTVTGFLPETLEQLVDGGYHRTSPNIGYCEFRREAGPPKELRLEAAHRGSTVHLVARYPTWGVNVQENHAAADCS